MFLKRDFFHVGPIREDIVLNGRGAAPIAIAVGEFSHVADLWGSHHISATKKKANLFEHLSLLPFSALSPAFFSALSLSSASFSALCLLPLFNRKCLAARDHVGVRKAVQQFDLLGWFGNLNSSTHGRGIQKWKVRCGLLLMVH